MLTTEVQDKLCRGCAHADLACLLQGPEQECTSADSMQAPSPADSTNICLLEDVAAEQLALWLAEDKRQLVFVEGSWLLGLPAEQQDAVVATFQQHGYWLLHDLKDGLLLASKQGLQQLEQSFMEREAQLFGCASSGSSCTAGSVTEPFAAAADVSGSVLAPGDGRNPPTSQRHLEQQQDVEGEQQDDLGSKHRKQHRGRQRDQGQHQGQQQQPQQAHEGDEQAAGNGSNSSSSSRSQPTTSSAGGAAASRQSCSYHKLHSNLWQPIVVRDKLRHAHGDTVPLPALYRPDLMEEEPGLQVEVASHGLDVTMRLKACSMPPGDQVCCLCQYGSSACCKMVTLRREFIHAHAWVGQAVLQGTNTTRG